MPNGTSDSPLHDFLAVIRRRIWIPILCLVLLPGLALVFTSLQEKTYTTNAKLLFRSSELPDQVLGGGVQTGGSSDPGREAATNAELVSLRAVADGTAKRLGIPVAGKVNVTPSGDSDVLSVTAEDTKPRVAAAIANAYAQEYVRFRRRSDERTLDTARGRLRRRIAAVQRGARNSTDPQARTAASRRVLTLREQDAELATLAAVQAGNAEVVQTARVPNSPSSPKPLQNVGIAAALGLVLGIALAAFFDVLDRRLQDRRSVQDIFRSPVLGAIAQTPALADNDSPLEPVDVEAFRILDANLQHFNAEQSPKSILVTSAAPGEGKSTIAWNLAVAAAEAGKKAIVVEAELRRPTFVARSGLPPEPGLTDILAGGVPAREAINEIVTNGGGGSSLLSVIVGGGTHDNPNRLLGSDRMVELVNELEAGYDIVVIDAPPPTVVSETIPIVTQVDGVIVVARFAMTNEQAAEHLREELEQLGAPVLGVVLNGVRPQDGYHGQARRYTAAYAGSGSSADR